MLRNFKPLFEELDVHYSPKLTSLTQLEEKVDMIMEHLGLELIDVPAKKELQKKKEA